MGRFTRTNEERRLMYEYKGLVLRVVDGDTYDILITEYLKVNNLLKQK